MATASPALSSLEAMLVLLMRGSGGGGGDEDMPVDGGLASPSPPPPPLPARPMPRGRHPSHYTVVRPAGSWTTPPPPPPVKEDASTTTDDDDSLLAELERKAAEVEAQLQQKEEDNAALKRRIESYHVEWLKREIKTKSLEEACQEQMAALQLRAVQDAKAKADDEMPRDRRESLESLMKMSDEPSAARRQAVGGRRSSTVNRLSSEFRRQSQALDRGTSALVVAEQPSRPWQPAVPSANSVDDLKKLKAQFCAWKKDYKARLRKAKAELDKERRHRGGCWI